MNLALSKMELEIILASLEVQIQRHYGVRYKQDKINALERLSKKVQDALNNYAS